MSASSFAAAIAISLEDYLSGRLYANAESIFQEALDPVVKGEMRKAFPDDAASEYNQFATKLKAKDDARTQRVADLQTQLAALGVPSTQSETNTVRFRSAI